MSLIEITLSLLLFASTAGSLMDMWYEAAHGVKQAASERRLDDIAEAAAERFMAGQSITAGTVTDTSGLAYTISVVTDQGGAQEVVVNSDSLEQSLFVAVP